MPDTALTPRQRAAHKAHATKLIERLYLHAMGRVEMTATQVNAARIVIGKFVPDLRAVEVDVKVEARSPHALSADALMRVINGEAQAIGDDGEARTPTPIGFDGGVVVTVTDPPPEQKIPQKQTPDERREFLLERLPDPPKGYVYGDVSQNGNSLELVKVEDENGK